MKKIDERKIKRDRYLTKEKTVALMATLGFIINSLTANATKITAGSTGGTTITNKDGVYDIETTNKKGNNAFNHFNQFELSPNNIANMYFGTKQDNSAENLFNFVDSRIEVNGTVNAIKNNKIGGNLYFLSSDGMVVGNTGTINTGSLHVITPSKIAYTDAVQKAGAGEVATGIIPNAKGEIQIPLNPEGTIVVRGQINAVDQIGLYAANIKVGNVGTETNGSTDYTKKVNLRTGVVNFSDLVNIKDVDGKIIDSGLNGEQLEATKTGNGNIILMAKADTESSVDQTFNDMLGDVITLDGVVPRNIKASIEINGDISATGDIVAKAEAVNGTVSAIDEKTGDVLYNSNPLVSTTAKVDIKGGTLTAKNIDIDAVSTNKYIELVGGATGNTTGAQGSAGILGAIGQKIKVDGSIGALKGDATVNVGKSAIIDASENLDISAKNDVSLTLGSSVSARKSKWVKLKAMAGVGGKPGALSYLPATAAAVGYAEGNASVNVEGNLKSGGKMKLEASSSNEMDLNATAMLNKADNKLIVGLGLAVGNNNSSVNITNGATINAGKDLDIKSTATNSLTSIVDVVAGNVTPFATTVNLVAYDSSSNINIKDSSITSEGNIDIDSQNIVTENKIISDNTAGKKKTWLQKFKKDELNAIKNGAEAQRLINNLKGLTGFSSGATPQNSTSEAKAGGKDSGKKAGIGEKIALGAAMAFVGEENSSNVNIQSSNITAKNDLNINSKTHIQDTLMSVAGDTVRDNKTNFAIGAGVLYEQVGNTSSIMIDGEQMTTDDKSSVITVENGNINIHSTTQMDYARVDRMVQELKDSIANLQSALNELKNYSLDEAIRTTIAELEKNLQGLESEVGDFSASMQGVQLDELFGENGVYQSFAMIKQAQAVSEQLAALSTRLGANLTPDFASLMSAVTDSIMNATEFANVGNYVNFSVRATARNLKGDVGIAGAVSITNLQNDSKVVIGNGTTLNAKKDLNIESTNKVDAVNVGGNIGQLVIKANGGGTNENSTAIGGSFIMQDFDSNNIIAVAEGAKLKGSNINITADNDIFNVDAVLSAGKSAGNAINGMVSYSTGSVNNIISIDDEVLLETTGDTTEDKNDDKITIKADSDTFVVNVAGGIAKGGNVGAGVGVAINEFEVNNKVEIKDNDNNEELAKLVGHQHKNKVLDVIKNMSVGDLIFKDDEEDKQNQNQNIGVFKGDKLSIAKADAGIKTNQFNANAITTGEINSISVAGTVASGNSQQKEGIFDSLKNNINSTITNFNKQIDSAIGKFNNNGAVNDLMNRGNSIGGSGKVVANGAGSTKPNNVVDNTGAAKPSLNISTAGSSSTNIIDNVTKTEIDGIDITLRGENSSVNVTAKDESFTGAWSGAAAINWMNGKSGSTGGGQASGGTSVGVHGAVGINIVDRDITAQMKNLTIKDANSINVESVNDSVTVAAGLGLGLSKGGTGKNYQGGTSVSLNDITHNTNALLENVDTDTTIEKNRSNIKVNALESGIQVTGGVNVNVGKSSGAAGAAVTVANIKNTINAGIKGGNLNKVGNVNVDGTLDITQVTAAAAIGATSSEGSVGVFEGAVVYNGTGNTVNSFIDSANIDADGNINVTAGDTKSSLDKNKYTETLKDFGIDSTGEGYYNGLETGVSGDGNRTTIENDKSGSTIVTGALSVAGSNSNALGAGVVVNNIANKFTAEIKGSEKNNITADTINVGAAADTFVVGAAGGVGVGKDSFGGMGSVSWQELTNNVASKISGVNITAREVNVTSKNNAFETNSAGQVTYGGKAAAGAALVYTNIENSTSAIVENATINLKNTKDDTKEKSVNVVAESGVENYNIAAGVSASTGNAAVAGSVAVSQGGNSTLATIEKTTIKDVDNLNTVATDENKVYTIAGTVTGSTGAAIGGSGAYSELAKNEVKAALNTVNITTGVSGNINIGAEETSKFYTIGVGAGGSSKVAVQGATSISQVNKIVNASMENTNINSEEDTEERKTDLNIIAQSSGEITSSASVVGGAVAVAAGAGVAVNKIEQDTSVTLSGGTQKDIENALIKAKSLANITTIGIGGGIGGTAGVASSIAVNLINNNTKTTMLNNTLNANGSVGVIAKSDDIIANYAGTLAGGGTAAIGTSVSVNQISGDTLVTLNNANVTANGKGNGIEVDSKIENGSIIDSVIDGDKTLIGNDLDKDRKEETIKGIVLDSSATHTLKSVLANGGVAGTAAVNGTVNVNEIGGNTGASVTGSNLNSAENLSVRAKDYTNSSGLVTTAAIAGTGAGVGASSDTNIVDRDANVTIGNSNLTGNKVDIDAVSKQGISSFGIGVAGAGIGGAVAGTVTVVDLKGDTSVIIKDNSKIKANNENVDINADHYGTINAGTGTVAIGAGVGAAVSVIKDQNHTIIDIAKTDITANKNVNIGANNVSKVTPTVTAVAGAGVGAGVAGTVAINNIANVVATNISDSNIKSNSGNININAKNRFENNLVGVGVAGGGFAGVGAVVNVNTVDSAVAANISGTTITADNGDIKVNAEEERDIEQVVSNTAVGGAAVGANVLVNNFGKAENLDIDLDDYYEQANTATGQNKYDDIVGGILGENGVSTDNEVTADKGGSNPDSNYETGIKVNIDNGSKLAGNNVNVNAKETNKITSTSVGTAAGGVSASGTVAITNINRNVGINIANSDIKTKDKINIEANTTGDVNLDVWQGSAGVASIGAAYGAINSFGKSLVNLSGTNLTSGSIDVANKDNLAISSKASGLTGGVIAAGAIVSQAENKGSVAINLEGSTLTSTDDKNGKINIKAEKANNVKAEAIGGSVGVISGNAVTATAKDNGRSEINIGRLKGTLSSIIGKDIDINAINKMGVQAKSGSAATGYLGTAGVSVTLAETDGKALIKAEDGAILEGDKIDVNAEIGTLDNKEYTVSAETDSASTALEGATDANIAHVINNSSAEVKLKNMKIGSAEEINITSKNNTKLKADIDSLSFGGVFAAGANEAQMENNGKAIVEFSNNGELTEVEKLNIEGTSSSENTLISNGNGGGGLAGLGAAIIKNNINTKADVVFGGNWKVADILDIKASDNNKVSLSADSTRGGLVGANGINIENNVSNKEATKVKIVDGTKVSGTGSVNVESRNDIDVDINASGAAYGAVGNANVIVKNNVDKKTEIEIGKADIVTDGKQEYQGFTNADILVKNKIDAIGAVAITIGKTKNTLNTSNKISLAENGNLKTNKYNQDIILAASDKIKDIVEGIAESSGAGAGSRAEVTSNFDRKNRIDVNGNILSYNDAKLYAGMDKNGVSSSVDYRALAHSYTHGVFTGATPILNTNISMGNQVATGVNSKVESVRNINIEANSGESRIEKAVQKYTWYDQENSSDYVISANGEKNENIDSVDNYADIQGKLHAGIYAKQDITIDGVVDLNKDKNGKTDIVDADVTSKPIITLGDGTKVDITTDIEDYANSLIKRYNEICELLKNYSDEKSAAYQGYQAEKTRILNTMLSLGLAEERTFKDGNTAIVPTGKLDIQYIKLSDLVASGGNITINSENIKNVTEGIDSGRVVAEGSPKVSITNNSNLYLKVGDIRILEKGGKISINNKVIKDVQSQDKPAINIANNWDSTLKVLDKNGKKQDVKVLSTIEITGNIENLIGDISIVNKGGDILMQGEKVGDSTNVLAGGNLNLSAKGSISQAYTAGITNIGTAPEQAWKDTMEQTKSEALDGNNLQGNQNKDFNKETGIKGDSTSSGMAAGGEIYLNGEVININGKVQSGFDKYEVVINGNDKGYNNQKIDNLINSYNKEWEKNKTVINTNNLKDYILTEGKTEYDSKTGTFYYKPATYYDPSTKQVVVENIDIGGGKVYVTGRVISTGNGKITALDGAANIKIDNNTSTALKVGSINNKDVAGIISINDTQKNIITEYYRDKTITKTLTDKKDSNGNYIYNVKEETIDGKTRYYTPDEGMRYNWTEGSTTGTETTYTQSNDFYLWGGIRLSMDQVISQGKGTPQETVQLDKNGKPVGSFISQDKNNTNDFTMNFTNKVEEKGEIVGKREWTDYHDFLHFSGTDYYEWTEKKGTEQSYTGSIKADRDIAIGFIGSENGNIDISSKNNIELAGSITNARGEKGTSVTTITSENGNITGTVGTITADTINLNGKTGIENITISGIEDTVNLNAIAKNGNVDITTKGNLSINEVIGKDKVNLSAYGDISQQNKNKTGVTGSRIDLVSENGGIDLVINSGDNVLSAGDTLSASVNASAKNNITLKESEGDMRIGKIYSSQGDVTLETDGYIVDALPTGEIKDNSSTEEKINRWEEAGLIASEELTAKKEAQYKEYTDGVKAEYDEYLALKGKNPETGSVEANRLETLEKKYNQYGSAEDYITNSDEGKYQLKVKNSGGKWNKDQLLYAIQESIINQDSGSTQKEVKDPNIKGVNITIKAGAGVGVDKGETTIDLNNLGTEELKKLASSEAADVIWNNKGDKPTAIIREKNPIGIQMIDKKGKLNVNAKDNIYLAARTDVGNGSSKVNTIYVDNISSKEGNIRLLGTGGVFNVSQSGPNFTGNNLILEGGTGDLGAIDKALTMNLNGTLTARSDGSIYLNQTTGDMNVAAIYAGKNVNLISAGNIFSTNVNVGDNAGSMSGTDEEGDENLVLGYINAGEGITLKASGDIGKENQGVNILNGKTHAVNATGNNIYLQGKKDGALLLGTINSSTGKLVVNSEDSIKTSESIDGKDITFNAENSIILGNAEKDTTITSDNLTLTANNGNINQLENNNIVSNIVTANANIGINLGSETNKFNSINLGNNREDILVNNSGANGLGVTFDRTENAGSITINNSTGNLVINNSVTATGENDIILNNGTGDITVAENANLTAGKDITMTTTGNIATNNSTLVATNKVGLSATGNIETAGNISGNDVEMTSTTGSINTNSSEIKANNNVTLNAAKDITNKNIITAGKDILVSNANGDLLLNKLEGGNIALNTTNGNITLTGNSTANTGDIKVTLGTATKDGITVNGNLVASNNVDISSTTGNVSIIGDITAKNDVLAKTETGDINITGDTIGNNDVAINTTAGDITVKGDTETTTGTVTIGTSETGNIQLTGNLVANQDINISTNKGNIGVTGNLTSGKDTIVATNKVGDITLTGNLVAKKDINVSTTEGNIGVTGNLASGKDTIVTTKEGAITLDKGENEYLVHSRKDVVISTGTGAITTTGNITGANNVALNTTAGDITVKGDTEATEGNVTIGTSETGNINVTGNLIAKKDINVSTNKGNIGVTGSLTSGKDTIVATNKVGDIQLTGNLVANNNVDISTTTGNISVTGDITAENDILAKAETGNINITGNTIGTNNVALKTTAGNITVEGDTEATEGNITIGTAEKGNIQLAGNLVANQNINVSTTEGNIGVTGNLTSGKDTTIATNKVGNITLDGDITSSEDTLVSTKEGNITLVAGTDINATKDITLSTETGSITGSNSKLVSGNNLIAKAINGVIKLAGLMKADKDISVNTTTGSIDLAGERVANNVTIGVAIGDVTLTGNTTAKAGDVKVTLGTATKDGITVNGNLVANNNVDISSTTGNVTITGDITAENDVLAKAETGNITITGDTTGNNDVAINTVDGDITVEGKVTATNGNTTVVAKETGNIQLTGDITTAKNTTISTEKVGNINLTGNINTKGDTLFSTNNGNIVVNKDRKDLNVNTGNNFTAKATDGDIILDGNINSTGVGRVETSTEGNININNFVAQNDLYVTTATGDIVGDNLESTNGSVNISSTEKGKVTIDDIKAGTTADIVTKDGDIDITNLLANKKVNISTENGNITSTGSLSSINDSMKVYSAKGDIKINDSYAKGENRVTAKDGNIYIKKLNGDFVIVTLGNKDKEMKVEETIVGKGAIVSGNDITVDNLGQRDGETVPVEITFNNSEDNKNAPISNIELHAKGIKNGVKVNRLWVYDANITTDSNILQFPELVVTGKGFFANDSTTVSVYGEDSLFDGSNIHIWNDADKKEWITLNFLPQGNTVYTDGRLLKLQDGYNVYYQRITAKDYMIDHLDYLSMEHKLNEIRDPFNYLYNPYLQYNLIDNNIKIDNSLEVVATEDDKIIIKEDGEVAEIIIDPSMKVLEKDKDLITSTLEENSK